MAKVIDFYQKLRDGKYEKYGLDAQKIKQLGDDIGVNWDEVDFGEFAQGVTCLLSPLPTPTSRTMIRT
jgi:hypothetical protein